MVVQTVNVNKLVTGSLLAVCVALGCGTAVTLQTDSECTQDFSLVYVWSVP